jgi:hypothetical protein
VYVEEEVVVSGACVGRREYAPPDMVVAVWGRAAWAALGGKLVVH